MRNKLVLGLLGPFVTAGSGWLAGAVGKYGMHLDKSGINALGVAGATAGASFVLKLIHDLVSGVERKDPKLAAEVKVIGADARTAVGAAEVVDPQLRQVAGQVEDEAAAALAAAFPSNPPTRPSVAA